MAEIFQPIRGREETINLQPIREGFLYFAYDSGNIYLDKNGRRYLMGGSSSGIIYADGSDAQIIKTLPNDDTSSEYSIAFNALENNSVPLVDSLILNTDGRFFRVTAVDVENQIINAILLAISGSGGSGPIGPVEPDVRINLLNNAYDYMSFIYGQDSYIEFIPEADRDNYVTLQIVVSLPDGTQVYEKPFIGIPANQLFRFNMGQVATGSNMTMTITLISSNSVTHPASSGGLVRVFNGLNVVALGVHKDSSFSTTNIKTGPVQVNYFIDGGTGFNLKVYPSIDGVLATELIADVAVGTTVRSVRIPTQSHGVHTIGIKVGTELPSGIVYTDEIEYEIAWADPNESIPLIWVKEIPDVIVQYENCTIDYMVYDPEKARTGSKAEVNLIDSLINEEVSTVYPQYSSTSNSWLTWDLTENYHVGNNTFTIQCGIASKDISFEVTTEGSRDLGLVDAGILKLNLSSTGRSNEESLAKRTTWEYTDIDNNTYTTTFNNFNWYNNGWKDDNDGKGAYLSVANGSSADINFATIPFNTGNLSYSIELRFRIRNVQEYSTLVKTEPYYYIIVDGVQQEQSVSINRIKAEGLTVATDADGNWLMDEANSIKITEYEQGVALKFWDSDTKQGLFVGTQEAYFKTPDNTVSVRYKEDDIINLTITAGYHDLLCIYLNGILSGAVDIGSNGFTPNTTKFEINSKYCDIDLYKLRVYEASGKPLTMPEVIHNYISDEHDLTLYDQNQLAKDDDATALSYKKILAYNDARLAELKEQVLQGHNLNEEAYNILTMPYATIEIIDNTTSFKDPTKTQRRTDDDRLPYFKGGSRYCEINFVNPVADALLEAGKITEEQYYTHAPSYKVVGAEINVQGTSSQGYPRRNFKTKMKSASGGKDAEKIAHDDWGWFYTKGSKAGTKFKKWNMDNRYHSTNKFTWKIDYMESSGTYNTGFANLMGNIYNFHPLDDYRFDDVNPVGLRTTVYGFPTMVFQKHSKPSDKNKIGTTYEDEIYEYIGRYNINLDKSSNELYGFEAEGEQKYITLDDGTHPPIADVAECWELTDNQGTWTSFSYPSDAQESHFSTYTNDSYINGVLIENPKLEVIRHFECRYNKYADFIEKIADDGKPYDLGGVQDKINDPDTKPEDKEIWESINTIPKMNRFIIDKWKNLESLVTWLDSTDTRKANNEVDITPVTYEVTSIPSDMTGATVEVMNGINYITFTKDTATYRLEKFRNEFSKHLNLTYCAIYYILTELLLCYDSRGKNMMLASWGPQEEGGDYIWYPIFYDIDTQLGLNNIGATLWDYDTDASAEGTFSTPSSVLWVNFATVFEDVIINTYKTYRSSKLTEENIEGAYLCDPEVFDSYAMRGVRPVLAIGLDEYVKYLKPSISGYLNTDGDTVPDSYGYVYAINGDRKLSRELLIRYRLNYLDSYWRAGSYSTEVVSGAGGCVIIRANANAGQTSDLFLDANSLSSIPAGANAGTTLQPYNTGITAGLDAIPEYTLTPFLKQYVFTYVDNQSSGRAIKFQGTPVEVAVSASVLDGFKTTPNLSQQITRIPGPQYISSLGDLSTKYLDQFQMETARRLLDLNLGSDIEGYYNNRTMANFILNDSMYDAGGALNTNRKTLLQKVILTNMGALSEAIDLSGSEKLQEFRALGTQIQGISLAEGAPLTTVHLPKTVNGLALAESKNLTKILDSRPVIRKPIAEGSEFYDHSTYEGLYIEDITDVDNSAVTLDLVSNVYVWQNLDNVHSDSSLMNLSIKGGNLKYESYKLLLKAIAAKEKNAASGIRLKIDFEDINWCPYTQLSIYDEYESVNASHYYQATDHSTFVPYVYNEATWMQLLKNGKIYYYEESADENIINSLDLLDFFIQDYNDGLSSQTKINHYMDMESATAHWPKLTGIIYIKNDEEHPIQEDKLTSVYAEKWPDLTIFAAHVAESNIVKYVYINPADGRENDFEIIRLANNVPHPVLPSSSPSRGAHYDFLGWSLYPDGKDENNNFSLFLTYDWTNANYPNAATELQQFTYTQENNALTLYAQFQVHNQLVSYYADGELVGGAPVLVPYNTAIQYPSEFAYKDDSNLAITETYKFIGYSTEEEDTWRTDYNNNIILSHPAPSIITRDMSLYAQFIQTSIFNNIASQDYFDFIIQDSGYIDALVGGSLPDGASTMPVDSSYNVTGPTCEIKVKNGVNLVGKVVLPAQATLNVNGQQKTLWITGIAENGFSIDNSKITHIFFEPNNKYRIIEKKAFYVNNNSTSALSYIDFENSDLRIIGQEAFVRCQKLSSYIMPPHVIDIQGGAFASCFDKADDIVIKIGSEVLRLGVYSFSNNMLGNNAEIWIGSEQKGAPLDLSYTHWANQPVTQRINQGADRYGIIKNIYFWSSKYYSLDDVISENLIVSGNNLGRQLVSSAFYIGDGTPENPRTVHVIHVE